MVFNDRKLSEDRSTEGRFDDHRSTRKHLTSTSYRNMWGSIDSARTYGTVRDYGTPFSPHLPGTVALISGGTLDCARYNILGIHPWLTLNAGATDTTLKWDDQSMTIGLDPLTAMQNILKRSALTNTHCKHTNNFRTTRLPLL